MLVEALQIHNVNDLVEKLPGPLHPSNAVKYAAFRAMQHAQGRAVRIYVSTDAELLAGACPLSREGLADVDRAVDFNGDGPARAGHAG